MKTQVIVRGAALPAALALAILSPNAVAAPPEARTPVSTNMTIRQTHPDGTALPETADRTTAGAFANERRMFSYHPNIVVPRRSYIASCNASGTRRIFASFTSKVSTGTATQGMIVSATVNTNGTVSGFTQDIFPECTNMAGIAAESDCSTVAALCRRPFTETGGVDLVAKLVAEGNNVNETEANRNAAKKWADNLTGDPQDDRMWLYEWKGTNVNPTLTAPTKRYVVSKAIRSTFTWPSASGPFSETGHHSLAMNDTHYGISLKSTTTVFNGQKHDGDSFIVFDHTATNPEIDMKRGWGWICGPGHTRTNQIALGAGGRFAALCTTDLGNDNTEGGVWMRAEAATAGVATPDGTLAHPLYKLNNNSINGGAGPLIPTATGFIGVIVGSDDPNNAVRSKIGLVTFNNAGEKQGPTRWVKSRPGYYLGYPQLVQLGTVPFRATAGGTTTQIPRYLLGWAEMMDAPVGSTAAEVAAAFSSPSPGNTQRVATRYYVQEIDAIGNLETGEETLVNGWGEQDRMISPRPGQAAWVYRPDATIKLTATGTLATATPPALNPPSPYSTQLTWTTYTSAMQPYPALP